MNENKMSVGAFFQKYTMVIALVVVVGFFAYISNGESLKPGTINNLISQNAYVFVLASGMLLCILTGGNIDLSVGSVVCFTAAVGCMLMAGGHNFWNSWPFAVLVMLAIGLAVGTFQGFWIAKVRVPAFIATLAGMYAFRGLSNVVLSGFQVPIENETFLFLFGGGANCYIPDFISQMMGKPGVFNLMNGVLGVAEMPDMKNLACIAIGHTGMLVFIAMQVRKMLIQKKLKIQQSVIGQIITTVLISLVIYWLTMTLARHNGFPTVLIWIGLVLGACQYITTKTAMGRHLYAVGGNEKATALSGVKTRNVYWFAYSTIGLLAGLAGILAAARAKGIDPTYGEGFEMDAIASCFIGGASAYGGIGKVSGMIIGAVLMGFINQGMNISKVPMNYQSVVKGAVLLIAVIFDVLSKRQKR